MNVVLFGPPGAGKGTQATAICEALSVPQVATGDIFRKHLKEGTELGKLARSYMDSGGLVPDEVVWDIVATRLAEPDCAGGVLMDGFPRTVRQAELMLAWLQGRGSTVHRVLALVVPDEELVARLSGRRSCLKCGATYHVQHNPPSVDGVCDRCGAEVVQRTDDSEATVRSRLATYHEQTAPVLAWFKGRVPTVELDGTGEIAAVSARISAALR